jgi:hypothetical protein
MGPVVFYMGLRETKRPTREVEKNEALKLRHARKGEFGGFEGNGLAGKPVGPFSILGSC